MEAVQESVFKRGTTVLMVSCAYCHDFIAPRPDEEDPDVLWCPSCERTVGVWTTNPPHA